MGNKKEDEYTIDDLVQKLYNYLKYKLNFDDIQATMTIFSLIVLPLSGYLGFSNYDTIFIQLFCGTLIVDLIVLIYSILKYKYMQNSRKNFVNDFKEKMKKNSKLVISNIAQVNDLSPYEFELFAKEYFKIKGYRTSPTQKTHDKGADVIIERGKYRTVVQVKHSKNTIKPYAVYQVVMAKKDYEADKCILFTNSDLTRTATHYAQTDQIQVINGHSISKYLRNNDPIRIKID